ncbi:hypothetical protein FB385_2910 [Paramicrobacterium agarici]|nr:hypothetical protein FB385_2910 [Microbacterium agarici]
MLAGSRIRRGVLCAAAAWAVVLALTACTRAAPETTPHTGETQTTAPSQETPANGDWVIGESAIGPFEIGMRYADALTTPDAEVTELCEGVAQIDVPGSPDVTMWATASEFDPASTLSEISISVSPDTTRAAEDGPMTEKGIGLGATVDELTSAYADARELDDTGVPGRSMYYVQSDGGGIIFTTGEGADTIWQISVTTGEVPSYEPCA